jgi:hypothetical protein
LSGIGKRDREVAPKCEAFREARRGSVPASAVKSKLYLITHNPQPISVILNGAKRSEESIFLYSAFLKGMKMDSSLRSE